MYDEPSWFNEHLPIIDPQNIIAAYNSTYWNRLLNDNFWKDYVKKHFTTILKPRSENLERDKENAWKELAIKCYNVWKNNIESAPGQQLTVATQYNLDVLVKLLITKCNINQKDESGNSALHWAASNGQLIIVKILIKQRANLNSLNHNHETALFLATKNKHVKVVGLLLKAGACPNISDSNGTSPLGLANSYADVPELSAKLQKFFAKDSQNHNITQRSRKQHVQAIKKTATTRTRKLPRCRSKENNNNTPNKRTKSTTYTNSPPEFFYSDTPQTLPLQAIDPTYSGSSTVSYVPKFL